MRHTARKRGKAGSGDSLMKVLGIETSCDETAAAVVEDGKRILSNVVATQIPWHAEYSGVVPEIASRKHAEWVLPVAIEALKSAQLSLSDIDGFAATNRPGLAGALLVGLTFGKTLAAAEGKPFIAVNHMLGHLYAAHLEREIQYPYLGLLVSGGHSIICKASDFDKIEVLGTTVDDAAGEAFDKVAKFYNLGYPGGVAIDKLAASGDPNAASFPLPKIDKSADGSGRLHRESAAHRYDVSYSGLKTAAINQIDKFWNPAYEKTPENIAAAFQKTAVQILLSRLFLAVEDTGIRRIVAGGGVAANSLLRKELAARGDLECIFPSLKLCTDNGAMIAGIGCRYLARGDASPKTVSVSPRVEGLRRIGR